LYYQKVLQKFNIYLRLATTLVDKTLERIQNFKKMLKIHYN